MSATSVGFKAMPISNLTTEHDLEGVQKLMEAYFDCLWTGDASLWRDVAFHPAAHLYSVGEDGSLQDWPIEEVMQKIANRPSPESQGAERKDVILSIDFTSPTTALVRCEVAVGERYYRDLLNLIKLDGGWKIVSKLFHILA